MKKLILMVVGMMGLIGQMGCLATGPTNLPVASGVALMVNTNTVLIGKQTNFFTANSNLLAATVAAINTNGLVSSTTLIATNNGIIIFVKQQGTNLTNFINGQIATVQPGTTNLTNWSSYQTNWFLPTNHVSITNARPPTAHGHVESDVTNLVSDLASRLVIANYLSEIASAAYLARSNLSVLSGAEVSNYVAGLTFTNYVLLTDTSVTNARPPTAHSHTETDVTNLVTDLANRLVVQNNLNDVASVATARANLGVYSAVQTLAQFVMKTNGVTIGGTNVTDGTNAALTVQGDLSNYNTNHALLEVQNLAISDNATGYMVWRIRNGNQIGLTMDDYWNLRLNYGSLTNAGTMTQSGAARFLGAVTILEPAATNQPVTLYYATNAIGTVAGNVLTLSNNVLAAVTGTNTVRITAEGTLSNNVLTAITGTNSVRITAEGTISNNLVSALVATNLAVTNAAAVLSNNVLTAITGTNSVRITAEGTLSNNVVAAVTGTNAVRITAEGTLSNNVIAAVTGTNSARITAEGTLSNNVMTAVTGTNSVRITAEGTLSNNLISAVVATNAALTNLFAAAITNNNAAKVVLQNGLDVGDNNGNSIVNFTNRTLNRVNVSTEWPSVDWQNFRLEVPAPYGDQIRLDWNAKELYGGWTVDGDPSATNGIATKAYVDAHSGGGLVNVQDLGDGMVVTNGGSITAGNGAFTVDSAGNTGTGNITASGSIATGAAAVYLEPDGSMGAASGSFTVSTSADVNANSYTGNGDNLNHSSQSAPTGWTYSTTPDQWVRVLVEGNPRYIPVWIAP